MASSAGTRDARSRPLQDMFTSVPPRYDLINRVVTWGQDDRWRRLAARECLAPRPHRALDLCCGTGKLALEVARISDGGTQTVAVDFSLPMLKIATQEASHLDQDRAVSFVYGDAAALPFPDGHFDCVGISFAFRNLTYKNPLTLRYLAEVARVLRPGGRFVIVESSQPGSRLLRRLFHLYLRAFVFRFGYRLSGNRGAYRYLAESAARFYAPEELRELLIAAGFSTVHSKSLMFGTIGIHVATTRLQEKVTQGMGLPFLPPSWPGRGGRPIWAARWSKGFYITPAGVN